MTFTTLTPDVAYARDWEGQFLREYLDADLATLHMESVRKDLRLHLSEALNLDLSDSDTATYLDDLVARHEERLVNAATLLQLAYIFGRKAAGKTLPLNAEKAEKWMAEYNKVRRGFRGLKTRRSGTQRSRVAQRRG